MKNQHALCETASTSTMNIRYRFFFMIFNLMIKTRPRPPKIGSFDVQLRNCSVSAHNKNINVKYSISEKSRSAQKLQLRMNSMCNVDFFTLPTTALAIFFQFVSFCVLSSYAKYNKNVMYFVIHCLRLYAWRVKMHHHLNGMRCMVRFWAKPLERQIKRA